jgi:hypothetical protein
MPVRVQKHHSSVVHTSQVWCCKCTGHCHCAHALGTGCVCCSCCGVYLDRASFAFGVVAECTAGERPSMAVVARWQSWRVGCSCCSQQPHPLAHPPGLPLQAYTIAAYMCSVHGRMAVRAAVVTCSSSIPGGPRPVVHLESHCTVCDRGHRTQHLWLATCHGASRHGTSLLDLAYVAGSVIMASAHTHCQVSMAFMCTLCSVHIQSTHPSGGRLGAQWPPAHGHCSRTSATHCDQTRNASR